MLNCLNDNRELEFSKEISDYKDLYVCRRCGQKYIYDKIEDKFYYEEVKCPKHTTYMTYVDEVTQNDSLHECEKCNEFYIYNKDTHKVINIRENKKEKEIKNNKYNYHYKLNLVVGLILLLTVFIYSLFLISSLTKKMNEINSINQVENKDNHLYPLQTYEVTLVDYKEKDNSMFLYVNIDGRIRIFELPLYSKKQDFIIGDKYEIKLDKNLEIETIYGK